MQLAFLVMHNPTQTQTIFVKIESGMNPKTKEAVLIAVAAVVVVAGAVALRYFWSGTGAPAPIQTTEEALDVLSEAPPVQVETNPIKEVPDLNPVEKTNPFKVPNPFE